MNELVVQPAVQKQKRGIDGRVVVHKHQHKQIRLTKDVGLCTVLVCLNAIVLLLQLD